MTAIGTWIVDFDWEIDGTFETITVEFRPDHTFDSGNGGVGDWAEVDSLIVMKSEEGPHAAFAAVRVGDAMAGVGTTSGGFNAAWRARRVPSLGDEASADGLATSGLPANQPSVTASFLRSAVTTVADE